MNEDGTLDDATFHAEILDNPEAERKIARQAVDRAILRGLDPEVARKLYGVDDDRR